MQCRAINGGPRFRCGNCGNAGVVCSAVTNSARRGGFSPASLFAGGEQGAWYDPSDLSTLFQDTAGTVPVTTAGQSVARINDKSGRGNHLTQATAASRPAYQTSGGLHWLAFDGVDDFMTQAASPIYNGANGGAGIVAFRNSTNAAFPFDFQDGFGTNNRIGFRPSTGAIQIFSRRDGAGAINATGGAYTLGTDAIVGVEHNWLVGGVGSGVGYINGVSAVTLDTGVGAALAATNGSGGIGGRADGISIINGRIYGGIFLNRILTAPERASVTAFLATKSGI